MLLYMTLIEEPTHQDLFAELYDAYRHSMFQITCAILKDHHWAEDAVSEAFFKIAKNMTKISALSGQERKRYLVILTRNSALDLYRQRQSQETPIDFAEELADLQTADIDESVFQREGYDRLLRAIHALPPLYRDTMLLYYVYEHTAAEAAELLNVREDTVYARLSRGRRKLQELLEKEGISV